MSSSALAGYAVIQSSLLKHGRDDPDSLRPNSDPGCAPRPGQAHSLRRLCDTSTVPHDHPCSSGVAAATTPRFTRRAEIVEA